MKDIKIIIMKDIKTTVEVTCGDVNDCSKCNKKDCKYRTKDFNNKCVGCKHWWQQYAQCLSGTGCIKK